ncbi:MAG TPA: hypothetical protein ENN13_00195 [Candidatus Altiarchaeales archaeon]|nr:hypothetical protein [Candidatus Altiarchaeales archaeon]
MSELEELRARVRELEAELVRREQWIASLQEDAVRSMNPEDIIAGIERQQIQSLSYHLMRENRKNIELQAKVREIEKKLGEKEREVNNIKIKLSEGLEDFDFEVSGKAKKGGQAIDICEIIPEEEVMELFKIDTSKKEKRKAPDELRELVKFIAKHKNVKIADAAIVLKMDKDRVKKLADCLRAKNLVVGGETLDSTVSATKALLDVAGRL